MTIVQVSDKKTRKEFLDTARAVYKNDPVWVCPLDAQIEAIFDPRVNSFFKHGEAARWVLKDANGQLIGRVAAFINQKKAYAFDQPTGGMGFFECINDRDAAFILFDTCKRWLEERGMAAMDGPINFGENDNFWGLLVNGFTHPGVGMNYNPPYYQQLFESYGFQKYFEQITNHLNVHKPFPERFWKIAQWVSQKPGYTFEHLKVSNLEKYTSDFMDIYNNAWKFHEGFVPAEKNVLLESFRKMKPVMDERFIWFAYVNGDPAGFMVVVPDANQIIKKLNGKLGLWQKIKFFYYKKRKIINRLRVIIMGVKPEYQKHGLESGMIKQLNDAVIPLNQYNEVELSWVGDFNPKMRALYEATGSEPGKVHYTYRYMFDPNAVFKRSQIIAVDTSESIKRSSTAVSGD